MKLRTVGLISLIVGFAAAALVWQGIRDRTLNNLPMWQLQVVIGPFMLWLPSSALAKVVMAFGKTPVILSQLGLAMAALFLIGYGFQLGALFDPPEGVREIGLLGAWVISWLLVDLWTSSRKFEPAPVDT